jgi:hypothetical protein
MGDEGEYWRARKDWERRRKIKYENKISPVLDKLINHRECKEVGDHYRIRDWDFWHTGTVYNPKTKERISIYSLYRIINL